MLRNHLCKLAALFVVAAVLLVGCTTTGSSGSYPYQLNLEKIDKTVQLHTPLQTSYLEDKDVANIKAYAKGGSELSSPLPLKLEWRLDVENAEDLGLVYRITLFYDKDLTDVARTVETKYTHAEIFNLFTGTKYWLTVEAVKDGQVVAKANGSFKTDSALPRNLYIEGVTNSRDVGGWKTQDGGYVRQGLMYRTAKLNKNNMIKVNPLITEEGARTMIEDLKVKTELDLRRDLSNEVGGLTDTSVLGENVNYVCAAMLDKFPIIQKLSYPGIVEAFEVLADESNYPIFFHCSIGTDRTGAIAFFVLNLCGVSEEDVYRDYLFSNFGTIGSERTARQLKVYFDTIEPFEGKNWTEKTRSFLLSIGVTNEQMDSVVNIMKAK